MVHAGRPLCTESMGGAMWVFISHVLLGHASGQSGVMWHVKV